MNEELTEDVSSNPAKAAPPLANPSPERLGLLAWGIEGLRSGLMLRPRVGQAIPTPWQLLVLAIFPSVAFFGIQRFAIAGPVTFNAPVALNFMWSLGAMAWLGWWTLSARQQAAASGRLSRWFALASWSSVPANALIALLYVGYVRGWLPKPMMSANGFWATYCACVGWSVVAAVKVTAPFAASRSRLALFGPAMVALVALAIWQGLQSPAALWEEDRSAASAEPEAPRLRLTQEVFEQQQALWTQAVDALATREPGQRNVYAMVFAPYASEDVFLRESNMVTHLLEDRFDAKGRVLQLVNNVSTDATMPWATPLNLQRGIAALARRMDLDQDVLVIYLTSHGASDHKLAAAHWPLTVNWLTPETLRKALDDAGIRHRVVAISACYSGGWIDAVASDDTLLMTAADATHTSFGCGRLSELTFFGRAMFDEELRKTHSFEQAFAAAVPVIQQREVDAGKQDGFSNPQIRVGANIRPVLDQLQQRLDANPGP